MVSFPEKKKNSNIEDTILNMVLYDLSKLSKLSIGWRMSSGGGGGRGRVGLTTHPSKVYNLFCFNRTNMSNYRFQ